MPWRGFCMRLTECVKYLKESGDEYFIFMDSFDTYCLLPPSDFPWQHKDMDGVMLSAEKACYPDPEKAHHFTASSPWRYPNAGQVYGKASRYIELVERYPVPDDYHDQRWFTDRAIAGEILLDEECNLFQSIAFEEDGDFEYFPHERFRLRNKRTGTFPLFAHGNGKTDMNKIYLL
jgi:hypothetical protein